VSVNVDFAVSAPVDCEPDTFFAPDQAPDAVQPVAFVADQVNVALPCGATEAADALNVRLGTGTRSTVTDDVALPPAPSQTSEYVDVAASGPVDCDPEVAFVPDHAPDAVQLVAFADCHVS
jgi:hypothetical protein